MFEPAFILHSINIRAGVPLRMYCTVLLIQLKLQAAEKSASGDILQRFTDGFARYTRDKGAIFNRSRLPRVRDDQQFTQHDQELAK